MNKDTTTRERIADIICDCCEAHWNDVLKGADRILTIAAVGGERWVDCRESEPEHEGRYIVTYQSDGGRRRVFIGDYDPQRGWANLVEDTTVVAWMETPGPYQLPPPPAVGE